MSFPHSRAAHAITADLGARIEAQGWAPSERRVSAEFAGRVLLTLADYAHRDTGLAFPAVATVAKATGRDRRTVQAAIRKLERLRLVVLVRPAGHYRPAYYVVAIGPTADVAGTPSMGGTMPPDPDPEIRVDRIPSTQGETPLPPKPERLHV